ncbi:MAG: IclR family transcriptional regulator [Rubrivivax sp.]|jgi:DNA-binding IclR family transcriptional regulator|nr:IclR family transcriptional regulator [Rubrivivax sp.]
MSSDGLGHDSADESELRPADGTASTAPASDASGGQRSVQSVEVGGRLLLALADSRSDLSLKDLAARAGLTPSRAHPYLVSFSRLGLVEQRQASGRYALGPAALQIGLAALHQLDPIQAATPVAEALAARTGHAVALAVWGNFGPTVVRLIDARQPLHVMLRAGSVMSLTGTATGRAFVAALPLERLEHASPAALGEGPGARPWQERREELLAIAEESRAHGVSRAAGRPIPGVNAFSAAAFDHEGEPAIVITALDHEDRLDSRWSSATARAVREAAQTITQRLGGRPSLIS